MKTLHTKFSVTNESGVTVDFPVVEVNFDVDEATLMKIAARPLVISRQAILRKLDAKTLENMARGKIIINASNPSEVVETDEMVESRLFKLYMELTDDEATSKAMLKKSVAKHGNIRAAYMAAKEVIASKAK